MIARKGIVIYSGINKTLETVYCAIDRKRYEVWHIPFEEENRRYYEGEGVPPSEWLWENPVVMAQKNALVEDIREGDEVILLLTDLLHHLTAYNSFRALNKGHWFHLHVVMMVNLGHRVATDAGILRLLPYYFEADSIRFLDVNDLLFDQTNNRWVEYGTMEPLSYDETYVEAWGVAMPEMIDGINETDFSAYHSDASQIWVYDSTARGYVKHPVERLGALNAVMHQRRLHEVVATNMKPHNLCIRLKTKRYEFAHTHHLGYSERKCQQYAPCAGTCLQCEFYARELMIRLQKHIPQPQPLAYKDEVYAQISGVMRYRQDIDGPGLRSLVLFNECHLNCAYCLNKEMVNLLPCTTTISVSFLGNALYKDYIYHTLLEGGITFGGGEPLLNHHFIEVFHRTFPHWDIVIETSLNVETWRLEALAAFVSRWIVDIKDMNPRIYRAYTGQGNERVIENLRFLAAQGLSERVVCRVPHIEGFNTAEDVMRSKDALQALGFRTIDEFIYKVL